MKKKHYYSTRTTWENQLDWENKYLSQFETADPKITNGRYSGHLWQDDETGGYRLSDEQ